MRHGLSVMNKQGVFSGSNDTPLDAEGIKQCQDVAKTIVKLHIDEIVSSPMKRALDSAKIIAESIKFPKNKIIISDLLVERNFGPLEGTEYSRQHNLDEVSGVEHSSSLIYRAEQVLKLVNSLEANSVLIVSHGAMGRALKHVIDPTIDYQHIPSFNNAEVIKLI